MRIANFPPPYDIKQTDIWLDKIPDWSSFEDLCMVLAEHKFKVDNIKKYGIRGQSQEGIDIYYYDHTDNSYLIIQCKNVKDFSPTGIKNAVDKFLAGQFSVDCKKFILCASANLSKTDRQKALHEADVKLKKLGISFSVWDYVELNKLLKQHYKVIGDFFGAQWIRKTVGTEAYDNYMASFKPEIIRPLKIDYSGIKNYISRSISAIGEHNTIEFLLDRKRKTLVDIIESTENDGKKFILLSEGGYGKSIELANVASCFSKASSKLFPIKIELRGCVENEEIEKMLSRICANWDGVTDAELVLLFDGLDEVSEKEYHEFIKRINIFHQKRPCKIVISSRTNHFNTFNGQSLLADFQIIFLNALEFEEINKFLDLKLGNSRSIFDSIISKSGFADLLNSPFYLIQIISIFDDTYLNNEFPKSKSEIFDRIIEKHFDKDNEKFAAIGFNVNQSKKQLIDLLKVIAFSMTQLAKNTLKLEELQEIVSKETWRLVRFTSLLNYNDNVYQFAHNLIQEYLTALCLRDFDAKIIKELIAFKPDFIKIKNKWQNPLSFLISSLPKTNEKNETIINWVSEVEPEVLVNMESDKFSNELRFLITKKIIEKYKAKGTHIPYYYFSGTDLGKFSGYTKKMLDFWLAEVLSGDSPDETRFFCIRIVQNFDNFFGKEEYIKNILENCVFNDLFPIFIQAEAIKSIAALGKYHDVHSSYNKILKTSKNVQDNVIRYAIYTLMEALEFEDNFLDFVIEGVMHSNTRKDSVPYGEKKVIERFFLKSTESKNVKKVIRLLMSDSKLLRESYGSKLSFEIDFMTSLISNAIIAYDKDSSITDDLILLLEKEISLRPDRDKSMLEIKRFFIETNTLDIAFTFFYNDAKNTHKEKWWVAFIGLIQFASKTNLRIIYSDFEQGILNNGFVFSCLNRLANIDKDLYTWFYQYLNKQSNNQFAFAVDNFDWNEHRNNQQKKNQEILLNKKMFFKEVKKVFTSYKQKQFTKQELWDYDKEINKGEEKQNNTLVLPLLRDWAEALSKIDYQTIVQKYNDSRRWEGYVINEVVRMLQNKQVISDALQEYCKQYVTKTLLKTNLKSSVKDLPNGGFNCTYFSNQLNLFCRHWQIDLTDEQILDLLFTDFDGVYEHDNNHKEIRPAHYVLNKISDKNSIKNRVLSNIKDNSLPIMVLGTQFYVCHKLGITEAKIFLYKELEQNRFSEHEKIRILKFYLDLGGSASDLVDVFDSYPKLDYWYWHLVDKLMYDHSPLVCEKLICLLNTETISDQDKATVAFNLLKQSRIEGIVYFCEYVKTKEVSPYDHHFWTSIVHVNFPVRDSLTLLFDILEIPFSKEIPAPEDRPFDGLDEAIITLINIIGLSSDEGYLKALEFYSKFILENKNKYPRAKNIYYTIDSLQNQYFKNKEEKITIEDVISTNRSLGLTA